MAAMLGAAPLMVGFGEGAELRRPLGITIVSGLIVSQLATSTPHRSSISISTVSVSGRGARAKLRLICQFLTKSARIAKGAESEAHI